MPDGLETLYTNVVVETARAPRHRGLPQAPSGQSYGHNPLCGDTCVVGVRVDGAGVVREVGFEGDACAICLAVAEVMAEVVENRPVVEADGLRAGFTRMVTTGDADDLPMALHPFAELTAYPARIRCATLPWAALAGALSGKPETSSE